MESYEIVEIFPDHPWYLSQKNNRSLQGHFFKGVQFAVVENLDDSEGAGPYQQPIAMFFGPDAVAYAYQYCSRLNQRESE